MFSLAYSSYSTLNMPFAITTSSYASSTNLENNLLVGFDFIWRCNIFHHVPGNPIKVGVGFLSNSLKCRRYHCMGTPMLHPLAIVMLAIVLLAIVPLAIVLWL